MTNKIILKSGEYRLSKVGEPERESDRNKSLLFLILMIIAIVFLITDIVYLIYNIWLLVIATILNLTIILFFIGLPVLIQGLIGLVISLSIMAVLIFLIVYFNRKRKYYRE